MSEPTTYTILTNNDGEPICVTEAGEHPLNLENVVRKQDYDQLRAEKDRLENRVKVAEKKADVVTRLPFCPDHRDKVAGKECRECELERMEKKLDNEVRDRKSIFECWTTDKRANFRIKAEKDRLENQLDDEIKGRKSLVDRLASTITAHNQAKTERDKAVSTAQWNLDRAQQAEAEVERLKGELEAARQVVEAAKEAQYGSIITNEAFDLDRAIKHYDQQCEAGEGVRYWTDGHTVWWFSDKEPSGWWARDGHWYYEEIERSENRCRQEADVWQCGEHQAFRIVDGKSTNPETGNVASEKPEPLLDYPAAARAIHVWLMDFCDESLPFPDMVAEAARRASKHIVAQHPQPPTGPFYNSAGNELLLTGEYRPTQTQNEWFYHEGEGRPMVAQARNNPVWILRPVNKPCTCRSEQHDYQDGPVYVWLHNGTWECRFFSDDTRKAHGAGRNPAEAVRNMIGVMGSQKRSEAAIKAEALREAAEKLVSVYGHQHQQQEARDGE